MILAGTKKNLILHDLLFLSLPTVIEQILSTLLQYVDTAMVGHLGEDATAAVSTTTTINWLVNSIPAAIGVAALALIARENGAGHQRFLKRLTGQLSLLTIVSGLFLTALCIALSPFIPVWMGAEKKVQGPASLYFLIISIPMLLRMSGYVFGAALRAVKNTKTPMYVNLIGNLLNMVLNWLLIYSAGLGVTGAAIATAIAYSFTGIVMIICVRRNKLLCWSKEDMRPDWRVLRSYRDISLPAMGTNVTSCLGYVVFAGMVSSMGTTIFAAHSIAVTAETLFYIPGYGLRTATSSLIGNAVGEGNITKERQTERCSIALTLSAMFLSGLLLYAIAYPLMRVFTDSQRVAELGAAMLRLVAFTEPFFGLMIVLEGISYGMGRVKGIFIVETLSMWGIRILFTYLVVHVWKLDLRAVWYCMIADNICKALLLLVLHIRLIRQQDQHRIRTVFQWLRR